MISVEWGRGMAQQCFIAEQEGRSCGFRSSHDRAPGADGGRGANIAAVVSRGGRPDLAGARLGAVRAPTLLIVGEDDETVLRLNWHARAELRCQSELAVVPGATHLFAEPGTLARAAGL